MIGIALHSPSLVSLMIDRERFSPYVVPRKFGDAEQADLEKLLTRKLPKGVKSLVLVEGVETISKLAALFSDITTKLIVFDAVENLKPITDSIIDVKKGDEDSIKPIKAEQLNHALVKTPADSLKDFRHDFVPGEQVILAKRGGRLTAILKGSSNTFKKAVLQYLLSTLSFAAVKRAGRKEKAKIAKIQTYINSEESMSLLYAFMDAKTYGTDPKEAALFSDADLEDLEYALDVLRDEDDISFKFEMPDEIKLARTAQ